MSIPLGSAHGGGGADRHRRDTQMTDGDRRKTAEILGISYKTLYNKTKKYKSEVADEPFS